MNDPITSLGDWIATATAGLPPSAAAKFRAEIADHAAEARQTYIAAGMPADEAGRAAIEALGDPDQVALTFREAHFSRRVYARGETAMLLMFGAFGVSILLSILSWQSDGAGVPHLISRWVILPYLAVNLASVFLFLSGIRAALTLLREQYDIDAPRWGWPTFAGLYAAAACSQIVSQALSWAGTDGGGVEIDAYPAVAGIWTQAANALSTVNQVGMIGVGLLLAAFCVAAWWPRRRRAGLTLTALLAMGAVGGTAMAVNCAMWLVVSQMIWLAPTADRVSYFVAPAYLIPYIWLEVTLTRLMGRMRKPGAVLA